MNSATTRLVACAIACCLLVAMTVTVASASGDPPYKIYAEAYFPGGSGAPYYGNPANGKAWFGNYGYGVQEWGDEVKMGQKPTGNVHPLALAPAMTAVTNSTDKLPPASYITGNPAKAGFSLGDGYIYFSNAWTSPLGGGYIERVPAWDSTAAPEILTWPAGTPPAGDSPDCATTDGTDIYTVCSSGSSNSQKNIYGWTRNGTTLTQKWMVTAANRHRAISYYAAGNKLYTANSSTGAIYELDPATGAGLATPIATASETYINQIARHGDKLYAVGELGNLHTFTFEDGAWSESAKNGLGVGKCRGIVLTNDGKYAWISSDAAGGPSLSGVSFWDLAPFTTMTDLSDPNNWKNGYPVYTQVVVTALGASGFWVENQNRTTGAWVPWTGTMPVVGNLVTIKGSGSVSAIGEKTLTPKDAEAVTDNGAPTNALTPLLVTNKSLGPATGSKGLGNAGLLVTVYGKLTGLIDDPFAIYLDDGSGVPSGIESPAKGVKILMANGQPISDDPGLYDALVDFYVNGTTTYAKVTGIVRLEQVGDSVIRRIDARSFDDIDLTAAP